MEISRLPMTVGQEVEQSSRVVPGEILEDYDGDYYGSWAYDGSGPREIEGIGVGKQTTPIIRRFNETMRQYDDQMPWNWHASERGNGCGSHVHFCVEELDDWDDTVEAWTITWNSIVDVLPVFAPFWLHNWSEGGRDGARHRGQSAVSYWASPVSRRYRPESMASALQSFHSRDWDSVIWNNENHSKPLTLELRMVDSHPAFALTGAKVLRRVVRQALDRGWSVKLDQEAGATVEQMYEKIYNIPAGKTLISRMQEDLPIVFERPIPGLGKEFDSMWDLLTSIMGLFPYKKGVSGHVYDLIRHAGEVEEEALVTDGGAGMPSPHNNPTAIWHTTDEDFAGWETGP